MQASATLVIAARVQALKAEGKDVVSFTAGEPDFPTPEHICAAAKRAIDDHRHKYTPTSGIPALRAAIAAKYRQKNLPYSERNVMATAGGKQAIYNTLLAVCKAGDEVIIPRPYWVSYPAQAELVGATPVFAQADQMGIIRVEAIEAALSEKSRVLILNSPCNPTGAIIPESELREIAKLALAKNLFVISDEVYDCFAFDSDLASIVEQPGILERTIVIGSCSKTYAMTGWRIGFCAGPQGIIDQMDAIQSHTTSGPSSIAQYAALEALTGDQQCVADMARAFKKRRDILCKLLDGLELSYYPTQGAFYAFIDISKYKLSADKFAKKLLDEELVAVIPGTQFGSEHHIRISYACSEGEIQKGMERIGRFVKKL